MKMEPIVSSETSAIRTQTPGNYPKRNKLHFKLIFLCFTGRHCIFNSSVDSIRFLNIFSFFCCNSPPPPKWARAIRLTRRKDSSVRVISSSQRLLSDKIQHSQHTEIQAPDGIRTHNLSWRADADLRLRTLGNWDRHF